MDYLKKLYEARCHPFSHLPLYRSKYYILNHRSLNATYKVFELKQSEDIFKFVSYIHHNINWLLVSRISI
jgi:hypothetical protein